jgi:uncharacterized protein YlxW (UPF0749 family)
MSRRHLEDARIADIEAGLASILAIPNSKTIYLTKKEADAAEQAVDLIRDLRAEVEHLRASIIRTENALADARRRQV